MLAKRQLAALLLLLAAGGGLWAYVEWGSSVASPEDPKSPVSAGQGQAEGEGESELILTRSSLGVENIGPLGSEIPEAPLWVQSLYPNTSYFQPDVVYNAWNLAYANKAFSIAGPAPGAQGITRVAIPHNGKRAEMAVDRTDAVRCEALEKGTVIIFGIFIAKNFAEIVFQTMEPLLRLLIKLGAVDVNTMALLPSTPVRLVLVGSAADYAQPVYELPLRMLQALQGKQGISYLGDFAKGTMCFRKAHILSQDVHYIYRYALPGLTPSMQYLDPTPPEYRPVWPTLARLISAHFLPLASAAPSRADTGVNVLIIQRSTGTHTHFGERRDFARAILNADALVARISKINTKIKVEAVVMEMLPLPEQLARLQHTHVLIAVHGAGCMHSAFLPPQSAFVQIEPFLVQHELYGKVCLASGHAACFVYRSPTIANSVMYSHQRLPEPCAKIVREKFHPDDPGHVLGDGAHQFGLTASQLVGINGAAFKEYSDFIAQHKLECQMNSYYWKQQDLVIDLDLFDVIVRAALKPFL